MAGKNTRIGAATGGSLISDAKLKQLYAGMLHSRLLAERALRVHSRNGSGPLYQSCSGQEALIAGWVIDLEPQDTIALASSKPTMTVMSAEMVRGGGVHATARGVYAEPQKLLSLDAQLKAAASMARANKRAKNTNVVVAFTGIATTALRAWHEALTVAAAQKLPILFVLDNNGRDGAVRPHGWADFALKAQSYGLPGITVDGNDVVAVYRVAHESLERARQGDGPVLVEGKAYRQAASSESAGDDPLVHMERYLKRKKLFQTEWKKRLAKEFSVDLDAAMRAAKKARAIATKPERQSLND